MKLKNIISFIFLAACLLFTFNSCSDVPAPYEIPGNSDTSIYGAGTQENPYSVKGAELNQNGAYAWVKAYIVGYVPGMTFSEMVFGAEGAGETNLVLAATPSENNFNYCMPVQLPIGDVRTGLNLKAHPDFLGKEVMVYGTLESYFGMPAVKNITAAIIDGNVIGELPQVTESIFEETFAESLGDFTINNVKVDPAMTSPVWQYDSYKYAKATSYYNNTNYEAESWLISPVIEIASTVTHATLSYEYVARYFNDINKDITLWITEVKADANDDWKQLTIPNHEVQSSWDVFVKSGDINLDEYKGKSVKVAFRYECTTKAGTYELKNFRIQDREAEISETPGTEEVIFSETFGESLGAFEIDNVKEAVGLGGEVWKFDAQYGAKATSYKDGENIPTESWLISPAISLKDVTAATLTFDHAGNFFNDIKTDVTVWVTEASAKNWKQLTVSTYPTSWTFVNSGDIDLSEYLGKEIKIGFKYVCTTKAGTYELKNFKIEQRQAGNTPDVPTDNSKDNPYTVATAIQKYNASSPLANTWVKGYIVGYVEGMSISGAKFDLTGEVSNTNMLIADSKDEKNYENCLVIQLPSGNIRTELNLKDNPENLGKQVTLKGSLEKYFGTYGLKSLTEYVIEGGETPVPEDKVTFTKVTSVANGTYVIASLSEDVYKVAQNVSSENNFGYLYVNDVTSDGNTISIAPKGHTFEIEKTDNGYTIKDESGRYMYMTGTYNSFNLSDSPTEGQYWDITVAADGTCTITNKSTSKWVQYDSNYNSFGVYNTQKGINPVLFKKN